MKYLKQYLVLNHMNNYPDNMILPGKKKNILDHKVPRFIIKEYYKSPAKKNRVGIDSYRVET